MAAPSATLAPALTPPPTMLPITPVSNAAVPSVATAQDKNPWAVSRKYTSSLGVLNQRVLNRPARYPPSAEAAKDIKVMPTILVTPNLVALMPSLAQGETSVRPKPVPNNNKINDSAADATAPANTAHHATALSFTG